MNSGDTKNLGSSYKLSIDLFSPWETPITFHVDDIIQLERSTQERKVAHISFLKQSSKAKNKRDIEMTLFLHNQVKEAVSELPKKSLKQKIFFYQTLKKLLPLFLDHREEKIENLIAEFKGWIDLASSLVTNSVHSTIVLLDEDIKKIQETTKLIKTTSSYTPISDLTAYSGADGCIDMEAYLLEFANQMNSNFEKLNLIEGSFFRKNLGNLEKDIKLCFSPKLYSEYLFPKKKVQAFIELYQKLLEMKNIFLEFSVDIREHWFYCKDQLEVFHLENFDKKSIAIAIYMEKHEKSLSAFFDDSNAEKILSDPNSFPLTVPSSVIDMSDSPATLKNEYEFMRFKEAYDLCISIFEDYEHNLPTKSNRNLFPDNNNIVRSNSDKIEDESDINNNTSDIVNDTITINNEEDNIVINNTSTESNTDSSNSNSNGNPVEILITPIIEIGKVSPEGENTSINLDNEINKNNNSSSSNNDVVECSEHSAVHSACSTRSHSRASSDDINRIDGVSGESTSSIIKKTKEKRSSEKKDKLIHSTPNSPTIKPKTESGEKKEKRKSDPNHSSRVKDNSRKAEWSMKKDRKKEEKSVYLEGSEDVKKSPELKKESRRVSVEQLPVPIIRTTDDRKKSVESKDKKRSRGHSPTAPTTTTTASTTTTTTTTNEFNLENIKSIDDLIFLTASMTTASTSHESLVDNTPEPTPEIVAPTVENNSSASGTCIFNFKIKEELIKNKRQRRKDCTLDINGNNIYPLILPNLSTHDLQPLLLVRDVSDFVSLMIEYDKYLYGLQDLSNSWNLTVRRLFEFFDNCKMFSSDLDNFYEVSKLPRIQQPKPMRRSKTTENIPQRQPLNARFADSNVEHGPTLRNEYKLDRIELLQSISNVDDNHSDKELSPRKSHSLSRKSMKGKSLSYNKDSSNINKVSNENTSTLHSNVVVTFHHYDDTKQQLVIPAGINSIFDLTQLIDLMLVSPSEIVVTQSSESLVLPRSSNLIRTSSSDPQLMPHHRDNLISGSKSSSGSLNAKKTSKNNVGQFMNLFPSSASSSSSPRSEKMPKSPKSDKKSSKQLPSTRTLSSDSDGSDSDSLELYVTTTRHRQSPTVLRKKQIKLSEKSKSVDKTDSEKEKELQFWNDKKMDWSKLDDIEDLKQNMYLRYI